MEWFKLPDPPTNKPAAPPTAGRQWAPNGATCAGWGSDGRFEGKWNTFVVLGTGNLLLECCGFTLLSFLHVMTCYNVVFTH